MMKCPAKLINLTKLFTKLLLLAHYKYVEKFLVLHNRSEEKENDKGIGLQAGKNAIAKSKRR